MNEVIQRELASLNRDFAAVSERLRRINDLVYEFQDDRPRPILGRSGSAERAKAGINMTHTFDGTECFCPPGHGHG